MKRSLKENKWFNYSLDPKNEKKKVQMIWILSILRHFFVSDIRVKMCCDYAAGIFIKF